MAEAEDIVTGWMALSSWERADHLAATPEDMTVLSSQLGLPVDYFYRLRQIAHAHPPEDRATASNAELCASHMTKRNAAPGILLEWYMYGLLRQPTDLGTCLARAWRAAEWPLEWVSQSEWLRMFHDAGFVTDEPGVTPPTESLQIYRGTIWSKRRGMAWTTDYEKAVWFAKRWQLTDDTARLHLSYNGAAKVGSNEEACVYPAIITPEGVLGILHGRNESEVVVDPALLPPIRRSSGIEVG